jgi:flavin reductase (DIM6/NTAB) family NADH-FMN oxidoreductase RutF
MDCIKTNTLIHIQFFPKMKLSMTLRMELSITQIVEECIMMYQSQLQKQEVSHNQTIQPKVYYYGTPVVLISTLNEDSTTNLAPISSTWALGNVLVIGLGMGGKSLENLQRHAECVLNVPDPNLWRHVEALAPLTGKKEIPAYKKGTFRYEKDKFGASDLTPLESVHVQPQRVSECPIQIEAKVMNIRIPEYNPVFAIVEVEVLHCHAHSRIVLDDSHIDPQEWSPLIYNFRHYFGLGEEIGKSFRSTT